MRLTITYEFVAHLKLSFIYSSEGLSDKNTVSFILHWAQQHGHTLTIVAEKGRLKTDIGKYIKRYILNINWIYLVEQLTLCAYFLILSRLPCMCTGACSL